MRQIISDVAKTLALVLCLILGILPVMYGQAVTVAGAGSTEFNTTYNYDTDISSKPSYLGGLCDEYLISWDGSQWVLSTLGLSMYTNANDTPKPPDSDWQVGFATGPAPTMSGDVTALPFPVSFLGFEGGSVDEKTVQLSWITASELNNSGFEIQRSTATNTWETLGSIEGAGTSTALQTYTFTDSTFPAQRIAYRLKQVDFDGLYSFSRQIEVDMRDQLKGLEIYPNPVKGPTLTVKIPGQEESQLSGKLYDIYGRQVADFPLQSGENRIDVGAVSPGMYVLEIYFQGQTRIERFRVE